MLNSTKSRINVSKTIGKRLLFDRSIEKEDEPAKKNFKLDLSWDYDAFVLPDEEDLSEQDKSLSTSILEISRNLVEETKKYEERNSDGSDDNSEESSLYDPLEDSFDYLNDSNY
uniref:Uncharacterized protein n=1 Tax=Strongyloides papillosus TaxID=174720 RepID=A0A0N5BLS7_STREA